MKTLTKKEKQWIKDVEKLLCNPPSERIGLFTIGDADLSVYDKTFDAQIDEFQDTRNADFCTAVQNIGCGLGTIYSAIQIHSTAG